MSPGESKLLVIDAGLGNLASVVNAFCRLGVNADVINNPNNIIKSSSISHIVLPGVGSYKQGMQNLEKAGWIKWLKQKSMDDRTPILGICLGMQLLSTYGREGSTDKVEGLDLIPGKVEILGEDLASIRLPHIGWNNVSWKDPQNKIYKYVNQNEDFYFVHSYHFIADRSDEIISETCYSNHVFTSGVCSENIIGLQFHPEKSQKAGSNILKSFIEL